MFDVRPYVLPVVGESTVRCLENHTGFDTLQCRLVCSAAVTVTVVCSCLVQSSVDLSWHMYGMTAQQHFRMGDRLPAAYRFKCLQSCHDEVAIFSLVITGCDACTEATLTRCFAHVRFRCRTVRHVPSVRPLQLDRLEAQCSDRKQ